MNNPKFDGLDDTLARAEKAERECDTLRSEVERFRECLMQTQTDRDTKQAEVERLTDTNKRLGVKIVALNTDNEHLAAERDSLRATVAAQAAELEKVMRLLQYSRTYIAIRLRQIERSAGVSVDTENDVRSDLDAVDAAIASHAPAVVSSEAAIEPREPT